jgi:asparagine synthase (glutamine-hydrolysing)
VSYPFLRSRTSPKYSGVFEYGKSIAEVYLLRRSHWLPHELVQFLDADLVREGWDMLSSVQQLKDITKDAENDHGKLALLEAQWYMRAQLLRDSDWASMAHSIELRVPFVDIELFTNLAPLIKSHVPPRKIDMAKSLKRSLPSEVLSRPKSGFSVPIRDWMMASDQTLSDRSIRGLAKFVSRRFNLPASW